MQIIERLKETFSGRLQKGGIMIQDLPVEVTTLDHGKEIYFHKKK